MLKYSNKFNNLIITGTPTFRYNYTEIGTTTTIGTSTYNYPHYLDCNFSSAGTITLPSISGIDGAEYEIAKADSGTITVIGIITTGTETINGTTTARMLNSQYQSLTVLATDSEWRTR